MPLRESNVLLLTGYVGGFCAVWWLSSPHVHNHLDNRLPAPPSEVLIQQVWDGETVCISNKFPGDADATGPGTTPVSRWRVDLTLPTRPAFLNSCRTCDQITTLMSSRHHNRNSSHHVLTRPCAECPLEQDCFCLTPCYPGKFTEPVCVLVSPL